MGKVYSVSLDDWLTMKLLKYDISECSRINTNGKFDLAIKCNQNCLKHCLKEIWDKAA